MKLRLLLVLFITTSYFTSAQDELANLKVSINMDNIGAITNSNGNVEGYYVFYQVEAKKKDYAYGIQILDTDLNQIAFKKYTAPKYTVLLTSKYDDNAISFLFENLKEENFKLVMFDKNAKRIKTKTFSFKNKTEYELHKLNQGVLLSDVTPIPGVGTTFTKYKKNKKQGYSIYCVATTKNEEGRWNRGWTYNSPSNAKEVKAGMIIAANKNFVVVNEHQRPGAWSRDFNYKILLLDTKTGKELDADLSKEGTPELFTNAFFDKDNTLVLMGEYFVTEDNPLKDQSKGLFIKTVDTTGTLLSDTHYAWEDINSKLSLAQGENREYVFFHRMLTTENGTFFAIGERYKKNLSAGGLAAKIITRGAASATKLKITDIVIVEFTRNFEINKVHTFDKHTSNVTNATDLGSPQVNAFITAAQGGFDYRFTQTSDTPNRFYSCFLNFERIKGEKNKNAFKTVVYDNGSFSEDKFYLSDKDDVRIFPGKNGNVAVFAYNKKERSITFSLEKLNIN